MTAGVRVWLQTDRAALYDSSVLSLDSATRGLLDTNTLPTSDWYEVTDMVQAVRVRRGKGDTELEPCGTGTGTVTLLDSAGLFDPLHRDSPVWPGVQSGMKVRVAQEAVATSVETGGGVTPAPVDVFVGRVDDTSIDREGPYAALVTLSLIDEFGVIAQADVAPQVRAAEPIDERIGWVLQTLAYQGDYVADAALNTATALDLTTVVMEGNAAKHLNELAASEGWGMVFCDRTGRFRFRRRRPFVTVGTSGLPLVIFQDVIVDDPLDGSLGSLGAYADSTTITGVLDGGAAYVDPMNPQVPVPAGTALSDDPRSVGYVEAPAESLGKTVINTITVTNRAGVTKTAQDLLSVQLSGVISQEVKQDEAWWSDTGAGGEAQRQATWAVGRLADGGYGITSVTVPTGQLPEAQRRLVAGLELGDLVRVTNQPRYTPTARRYNLTCFVIGIEHAAGRNGYGFQSTVRLATATGSSSWS